MSRAPVNSLNSADIEHLCETTAIAKQSIDILPATTMRLQGISEAQKADDVVQQVREYTKYGWPVYTPQNLLLEQYWTNRQHLTIIDDVLLFDSRLVIPRSLKLDIMNRLHEGHLGITNCRALASSSVWWPNISSDIEDMAKKKKKRRKKRKKKKRKEKCCVCPSSTRTERATLAFIVS